MERSVVCRLKGRHFGPQNQCTTDGERQGFLLPALFKPFRVGTAAQVKRIIENLTKNVPDISKPKLICSENTTYRAHILLPLDRAVGE